MSAQGLVSRVSPVHTALRNCTRDEGRSFEVGNQVLISSHRKLPRRSHACNPHGAIIALQHPDTALVWLGSFSSDRPAPDALDMSASLRSRPNLRTAANRRGVPMIGIGGSLAAPPLPHHLAYGSVPRRFEKLR